MKKNNVRLWIDIFHHFLTTINQLIEKIINRLFVIEYQYNHQLLSIFALYLNLTVVISPSRPLESLFVSNTLKHLYFTAAFLPWVFVQLDFIIPTVSAMLMPFQAPLVEGCSLGEMRLLEFSGVFLCVRVHQTVQNFSLPCSMSACYISADSRFGP